MKMVFTKKQMDHAEKYVLQEVKPAINIDYLSDNAAHRNWLYLQQAFLQQRNVPVRIGISFKANKEMEDKFKLMDMIQKTLTESLEAKTTQ